MIGDFQINKTFPLTSEFARLVKLTSSYTGQNLCAGGAHFRVGANITAYLCTRGVPLTAHRERGTSGPNSSTYLRCFQSRKKLFASIIGPRRMSGKMRVFVWSEHDWMTRNKNVHSFTSWIKRVRWFSFYYDLSTSPSISYGPDNAVR